MFKRNSAIGQAINAANRFLVLLTPLILFTFGLWAGYAVALKEFQTGTYNDFVGQTTPAIFVVLPLWLAAYLNDLINKYKEYRVRKRVSIRTNGLSKY